MRALKFITTLLLVNILITAISFADSKPKWSIYLDPFTTDENGSTISEQNVLLVAKQLKSQLEDKGFLVYIAKADAPLESRLFQARQFDVDLYISMRKSDKKCVDLYYPIRKYEDYKITEQNRSQLKGRDITELFSSLQNEYITVESARLVKILSQHLKAQQIPRCAEAQTKEDYILENTLCPTVIIDLSGATARVIAESVQEYFETSMRQPAGASRAKQPANLPGPPADKK
jgi:hypothetical protein